MPVVWNEDCLRHDPGGEVWLGVRDAGTEVAERALVLRDALAAAGAPVVPAARHGDEILRAVHDPALLDHLAGVWAEWERAGFPAEYGRDRVVPYVFPTAGMLAGLPLRSPPAVHGRAGQFCYDTMTLVGPGSWAAIRGAADAALTAAGLVSSGAPLAYALCRPPGHHATRAAYGGSCYLNNAAIAAQALLAAGAGAGRRTRHRRAPRQRHPDDLLRPRRRLLRVGAHRPGGGVVPALRWATRGSAAPARARAPTRTCRCRRAPATRAGSRRCGPCARTRPRTAPTPSWSRSAWTPPRPTREPAAGDRGRLPGGGPAGRRAGADGADPGGRLRPGHARPARGRRPHRRRQRRAGDRASRDQASRHATSCEALLTTRSSGSRAEQRSTATGQRG